MEHFSQDLVHMSLDLSRLFRRTMGCVVSEANLLQLHALSLLKEHGHLSMSEFAKAMNISPSTATEFADRLIRSGFITRITEPQNRRTVLISLTALGKRIIGKGIRRKKLLLTTLFSELPASDRAHLKRILPLLIQNVQSKFHPLPL